MTHPVLFIENGDSFSWNVIDALPVPRAEILVRTGREVALDPACLDGMGVVVVGPGPTDPARAGIADVIPAAAARALPLLGICLGHQALGLAHGARLVRTRPVHGKQALITFERARLFPGIVGPQLVMRYHSLSLDRVTPPLRVVATTADGIPMAIEHESLPMAGLQFHPDSFGTPAGRRMLEAFFEAVS
jgi:anthranilate synthase/aminodeoxychorismate synthase-like glutamine amidotransferase